MAYKDLPDYVLLEKLREKDTKAYDAIFFRYFKKIFSFAKSSLHDQEIAKELAMDVMTRFWQKQGDLLLHTDLNAYLYQSIRNALYNHWKRKAIHTVTIDNLIETFEPITEPADHELDCKELQQYYQKKLDQLSPQRKKIFRMSREQNMSHAEIANHLNLSVHTVKNHVSASLQYLREHLNEFATIFLPIVSLFVAFKK